jgi:hypothetical protein
VHAAANLERSTLEVYASIWNRYALPRLGDRRLRDLTPQTIARFRADLEADGVGPEAIRKTIAMLQGVLQRAVEWQRIKINPAKVVRKPPARRQRAVNALTPAQVETMRHALLADGRHRDCSRPLRQDLNEWRLRQGRPDKDAYVFPPPTVAPGVSTTGATAASARSPPRRKGPASTADAPTTCATRSRPLLIYEGRLSIVEIAAQLGHNPNVCLATYAHVVAELGDTRGVPPRTRSGPRATRLPQVLSEVYPARIRPMRVPCQFRFGGFGSTPGSPLPDSNRRPLPHHRFAVATALLSRCRARPAVQPGSASSSVATVSAAAPGKRPQSQPDVRRGPRRSPPAPGSSGPRRASADCPRPP